MRIGLALQGGVGDLILLSGIARALALGGHETTVWLPPHPLLCAAASHLDGFAAWRVLAKPDELPAEAVRTFDCCVRIANAYGDTKGTCVDAFAALIVGAGGPKIERYLPPIWHLGEAEERDAGAWLTGVYKRSTEPLVYFGNRAAFVSRSLDAKKFASLHDNFVRAGLRVVVDAVDEGYTKMAGCEFPVVGVSHLTTAVRAAIMARSSVVATVDTGVLHLAAALARPVVGFFGPTTLDYIAGGYRDVHAAPVLESMTCRGCFWQKDRGFKADKCNRFGCAQLAGLDIVATTRLVETLSGRVRHRTAGTSGITVNAAALRLASQEFLFGRKGQM